MHDESECGYGAIVESRDKDWLRVGALIGIKSHDADQWQIGIVRRLSRVNDDTSSVGIETLAETPTLAMLHDTTTPGYTVNGFDNSGASLPHASLWLDSTPEQRHDRSDSFHARQDLSRFMAHRNATSSPWATRSSTVKAGCASSPNR